MDANRCVPVAATCPEFPVLCAKFTPASRSLRAAAAQRFLALGEVHPGFALVTNKFHMWFAEVGQPCQELSPTLPGTLRLAGTSPACDTEGAVSMTSPLDLDLLLGRSVRPRPTVPRDPDSTGSRERSSVWPYWLRRCPCRCWLAAGKTRSARPMPS